MKCHRVLEFLFRNEQKDLWMELQKEQKTQIFMILLISYMIIFAVMLSLVLELAREVDLGLRR